jgi:hypothetical protein
MNMCEELDKVLNPREESRAVTRRTMAEASGVSYEDFKRDSTEAISDIEIAKSELLLAKQVTLELIRDCPDELQQDISQAFNEALQQLK